MSLLKYFSKAPSHAGLSSRAPAVSQILNLMKLPLSPSPLQLDYVSSDTEESEYQGAMSGCLSSLPDVSDSEEDPSVPLPLDSHARDVRIRQEPYQPKLLRYKVTVHRGKARIFCS